METNTENEDANNRPKLTDDEVLLQKDVDLQQHLKSLSLKSIDDYVSWCRENGLSTSMKRQSGRCRFNVVTGNGVQH